MSGRPEFRLVRERTDERKASWQNIRDNRARIRPQGPRDATDLAIPHARGAVGRAHL